MHGCNSVNSHIKYSIIIPVYNSERTIDLLISRIIEVFRSISDDYEIILVDDCSKDDSWNKLKSLHAKNDRIKVIHFIQNFGQHNATLCGLKHSKGKYAITLDDDLQHPPEEIPKLIKKINDSNWVVYGRFKTKNHSRFQNFLSNRFLSLNHKILKIPKDIKLTSFVIYNREAIENITTIKSSYIYLPAFVANSVPLDKITNVEVIHEKRKSGKSNYGLYRMFKFSLNLIINFSSIPLTFVGIMGVIISTLSIGYGVTIIIRKLLDPNYGVMGWNSLMVAVTLLSGSILIAIGVIGEYLRRILREMSYGKQYIIGEKWV